LFKIKQKIIFVIERHHLVCGAKEVGPFVYCRSHSSSTEEESPPPSTSLCISQNVTPRIAILCAETSKEKGFESMGLHDVAGGRPGKYRKAAVLRRNQPDSVTLVIHELRDGKVSRIAELRRLHNHRF
jgi:hypothetical protein